MMFFKIAILIAAASASATADRKRWYPLELSGRAAGGIPGPMGTIRETIQSNTLPKHYELIEASENVQASNFSGFGNARLPGFITLSGFGSALAEFNQDYQVSPLDGNYRSFGDTANYQRLSKEGKTEAGAKIQYSPKTGGWREIRPTAAGIELWHYPFFFRASATSDRFFRVHTIRPGTTAYKTIQPVLEAAHGMVNPVQDRSYEVHDQRWNDFDRRASAIDERLRQYSMVNPVQNRSYEVQNRMLRREEERLRQGYSMVNPVQNRSYEVQNRMLRREEERLRQGYDMVNPV